MTDDLDPDRLGPALHERVRDKHPDLDRLIDGATRAGTRIRHRRRAGASLAAVAGVATVALLGSQLTGGSSGTTGGGPAFADQPSVSAPSIPAVPSEAGVMSRSDRVVALTDVLRRLSSIEGKGELEAVDPQTLADLKVKLEQLETMEAVPVDPLPPEPSPVRVTAPGWECGPAADEKFSCESGSASVVVTWRAASLHEDYLDPGKSGPATFVSDVHGDLFATVMPDADTPQAEVDAVGASLVWD
jgi:hypothetical protein